MLRDKPAAAACGREWPSNCAVPARFAGEGAWRPRSAVAVAVGMLWSAGGVGRGVDTAPRDPRSATNFAAEGALPDAPAVGLALTGVLPPQVSRPAGGTDSAATAEVPAPPIPRAGSSIEGVLQLRRRAQGERAVLQPLARPGGLGAQAHRLYAAPSGTFAVPQFAHCVVVMRFSAL